MTRYNGKVRRICFNPQCDKEFTVTGGRMYCTFSCRRRAKKKREPDAAHKLDWKPVFPTAAQIEAAYHGTRYDRPEPGLGQAALSA